MSLNNDVKLTTTSPSTCSSSSGVTAHNPQTNAFTLVDGKMGGKEEARSKSISQQLKMEVPPHRRSTVTDSEIGDITEDVSRDSFSSRGDPTVSTARKSSVVEQKILKSEGIVKSFFGGLRGKIDPRREKQLSLAHSKVEELLKGAKEELRKEGLTDTQKTVARAKVKDFQKRADSISQQRGAIEAGKRLGNRGKVKDGAKKAKVLRKAEQKVEILEVEKNHLSDLENSLIKKIANEKKINELEVSGGGKRKILDLKNDLEINKEVIRLSLKFLPHLSEDTITVEGLKEEESIKVVELDKANDELLKAQEAVDTLGEWGKEGAESVKDKALKKDEAVAKKEKNKKAKEKTSRLVANFKAAYKNFEKDPLIPRKKYNEAISRMQRVYEQVVNNTAAKKAITKKFGGVISSKKLIEIDTRLKEISKKQVKQFSDGIQEDLSKGSGLVLKFQEQMNDDQYLKNLSEEDKAQIVGFFKFLDSTFPTTRKGKDKRADKVVNFSKERKAGEILGIREFNRGDNKAKVSDALENEALRAAIKSLEKEGE